MRKRCGIQKYDCTASATAIRGIAPVLSQRIPRLPTSIFCRFHGRLGRLEAEQLLSSDGDFLVRESTSQPGEYAITCRWNGNSIHFMVNKVCASSDCSMLSRAQGNAGTTSDI